MKTNRMLVGMLLLGLLLGLTIPWMQGLRGPGLAQGPGQTDASPHANMGTAFTYQGQLKNASGPVDDDCDFDFSLWDAAGSGEPPTGGTQIGTTQTKANVAVGEGLFTIPDLDFGDGAFNGEARWLEIAVRCPVGSGTHATLAPRQPLTPAPYALALPGLWTQQNTTSPNLIGGHSDNYVADGVYGATVGGGGMSGFNNMVTDDYGTVGGGIGNIAGNFAGTTTDAGFATVSGGSFNRARSRHSTVSGGFGNSANNEESTISGGSNNTADGFGATIPGGGHAWASHYGEMAYASGQFSEKGDAQTSVYVLRNETSSDSWTELYLDGNLAFERLTIASGRTVAFDILLVARRTTGTSMGCSFQGTIKNVGGTTSFVMPPSKACHKDVSSWDARVVADDANDALKIEVKGGILINIGWVARVQTAEVSY